MQLSFWMVIAHSTSYKLGIDLDCITYLKLQLSLYPNHVWLFPGVLQDCFHHLLSFTLE